MSNRPTIYDTEQLLSDIQKIQTTESALLNSLESDSTLTQAQRTGILNKINELSELRINLYKTLSNVNNYAKNNLDMSVSTFSHQENAIRVVENELNKLKGRLDDLKDEKNNKIRLVEINNYYSDKYYEYSQLMKVVIYTLLPIIILNIIYKYGILPYNIFIMIVILISIIGSYYFWTRFSTILIRDNMNYNKFDWGIQPPPIDSENDGNASDPWLSGGLPSTCIGSYCCSDGMEYDNIKDLCVFKK